MYNLDFNVIALALSFAFGAGTLPEGISTVDYQAGKVRIAAAYKQAAAACGSLSGNRNDICAAQANGKQTVATAELAASHTPTLKIQYQARLARAAADYAVAIEWCDELAGNTRAVCVKKAKATGTTATADATAQLKISEANAALREKSADARSTASDRTADARTDPAADQRHANYAVMNAECDGFAGDTRAAYLPNAQATETGVKADAEAIARPMKTAAATVSTTD